MTTILIVDDSPVDRRLVGGLLEIETEFSLQYAADGREALSLVEASEPDLVLTDMQMPAMDGLELVAAMHDRHPLVPVILMTSKGSEELAVSALRRGAANYVPKRALADELISTIRSVLAVSSHERGLARLMDCLERSEYAFELGADGALVSTLVGFLQQSVKHMGICDDSDRIRIGVALEEALVNAVFHGSLEISSELRETDRAAYHELIRRRRHESPYCDRRVHVTGTLTREQAVFVIKDDGPGFDPHRVPDPTDADLEKLSGRGLLLMRTFMDEVSYNETGNEVTLIKRHP